MGLVEVVDFGSAVQLLEELSSTDAEDHVLGDADMIIVIVEAAGNFTRLVIVVLKIGSEEEHWAGVEGVTREVESFDPDIFPMDIDGEFDSGITEEMRGLPAEGDGHLAIFSTDLVIIAVGPEHSDADHVLLKIMGGAHVRSGEETEAARVNLEALVDCELRGEVGDALRKIRVDFVGMGEFFGQERHGE